MRRVLWAITIIVSILIISCNGDDDNPTGNAPTISNLTVSPLSLIVNRGDGSATITFTFEFSDIDGDVATWNIRYDDGSESETALFNTENVTSGTITASYAASTLNSGVRPFQIWVTDTGGNSSNILNGSYSVETLIFSGTGTSNANTFHAIGGTAQFTMTHDGDSSFTVRLIDDTTEIEVGTLINSSGNYSGTVSADLSEGDYSLSVTADGNWSISITGNVERSDSSDTLPDLTFSGAGADFTEPFHSAGGRVEFVMTHDGESNFIIYLEDYITGEQIGFSLANEIGESSVRASRVLPEGDYLIIIQFADGNWTIEIKGNVSLIA